MRRQQPGQDDDPVRDRRATATSSRSNSRPTAFSGTWSATSSARWSMSGEDRFSTDDFADILAARDRTRAGDRRAAARPLPRPRRLPSGRSARPCRPLPPSISVPGSSPRPADPAHRSVSHASGRVGEGARRPTPATTSLPDLGEQLLLTNGRKTIRIRHFDETGTRRGVAQGESACLTRKRSAVQDRPSLPEFAPAATRGMEEQRERSGTTTRPPPGCGAGSPPAAAF